MQTLVEIFKEIGHFGNDIGCNDKGGTHTYLETYDKLFEPYRDSFGSILEIGLASGDSIKLWDRYFKHSRIVGVDLSIIFQPEKREESNNNIYLIAADATKPDIIAKLQEAVYPEEKHREVNLLPYFDIIIDDGSHVTQDQIDTFNLLKGQVNPNGLYIIEDILALDIERERYTSLHDNCEIVDMRHNGRFDNVLIIYRF